MRWSKPLSFLLSTLAVAILFTMHWIKQTFGEVTYEQIVWHILNVDTLQGFDHNYLRNALTHFVKIIIYSFRECPAYTLLYQFSPKDTGQSKVK